MLPCVLPLLLVQVSAHLLPLHVKVDETAAVLFTADCAAVPAVLTNEWPIILWGVSRLMAAAAAHYPADDLAPPSEGAGGG